MASPAEEWEERAGAYLTQNTVEGLREAIYARLRAATEWEAHAELLVSVVDSADEVRKAEGNYRTAAGLLDRLADATASRAVLFEEAVRVNRPKHLHLVKGGT